MGEARKNQLRALIKSKTEEVNRKVVQASKTSDADLDFQKRVDEIASSLRVTQIGLNDFAITACNPSEAPQHDDAKERGILFRGSMVKRLLMILPEGCWIVSGVSNVDGTPIMTAQVGNTDSRHDLWERMRAKRVTGRNFTILRNETALNAQLARWSDIRAKAERR